jgi:hypothetical protein
MNTMRTWYERLKFKLSGREPFLVWLQNNYPEQTTNTANKE